MSKRKFKIIDSDDEDNFLRGEFLPIEKFESFKLLQKNGPVQEGEGEERRTRTRLIKKPERFRSPEASPVRPLSPEYNDSPEHPGSPQIQAQAKDNIALYLDKTPVYENDNLKIFIEKKEFERQKKFKLEDHLYVMKIEVKKDSPIILLKDLMEILENSFIKIIHELKEHYGKNQETNLLYITIYQHRKAFTKVYFHNYLLT